MIDSTKVVLPAAQAFVSGTLEMPEEFSTSYADAALSWGDYPANAIMIVVFTLLALITLKNFLNISGLLLDSLSRWKASVNIDASIQLKSDRNILGYIYVLPLALVADRFCFIPAEMMAAVPASWHCPATLGIICAWLILRHLIFKLLSLRARRIETFRTAHKSFYNFLILCALLLIFTAGAVSFLNVDEMVARKILLYESGTMYLLYILRKSQILGSFCSPLTTFLYLCALDFVPTGALIAGSLLL